jgi:hypothetical protein
MFEKRITEEDVYRIIKEKVQEHLEARHNDPYEPYCETCGCLIAPYMEIEGKKEVRQRNVFHWFGENSTADYIFTPYYCKVHAPQTKKEDNEANTRCI